MRALACLVALWSLATVILLAPISAAASGAPGFVKRLYDPQVPLLGPVAYPSGMVALSDVQLVGLQCFEEYHSLFDSREVTYQYARVSYNGNQPVWQPAAPEVEQQIRDTERTLGGPFSTYALCAVEDGRTLLRYEFERGGGGMGNVTSFAWVDGQQTHPIVSIPNDGMPYRTCLTAQLTTTGQLYVRCFGGDGGGGFAAVYVVDVASGSYRQLTRCYSAPEHDFAPLDRIVVVVDCGATGTFRYQP